MLLELLAYHVSAVVLLMLMMTCAQLSKDGSDIEALLVVGETLHERRRLSFHKI